LATVQKNSFCCICPWIYDTTFNMGWRARSYWWR